jgi:hypothetical protein
MSGTSSVGTKFKQGNTEVGSLTTINGVEVTAETIDKTVLDSPDGYREFGQGFKDGGEVSVEGYLDPDDDGQMAMHTAFESGDAEDYTIELPTKPKIQWDFKAIVTGFTAGNAELEGLIAFGATIKITGKPTLTIGTSGGTGGTGTGGTGS